ncbi:unnamed protein product [Nesidiocoris tenuis]|uniref:Inhibitor of growth protein N-terminal histone-binding domain-containing protein n=1 Tax=Nesidiocoris tenuis TaxID=355587 RepID=A0A6H5GQV1_9HEMI|nr:unnamed protein product [Nesidiocoris tenuis]
MLFLEDYLENTVDSLEKRVKFFFMNAKKMKQADKDMEYEAIRKSYYKTVEDAEEKVHIAHQMYDLVSRYLKRLDQETQKFKLELEADHIGITEVLEKKKRRDSSASTDLKRKVTSTGTGPGIAGGLTTDRAVLPDLRVALGGCIGGVVSGGVGGGGLGTAQSVAPPPPMAYTLGHHIGAGGTAIAAAASQAIAATQQVPIINMQQGRRTASLKASYEAIHGAGGTTVPGGIPGVPAELSISKELAGAAQTAIAAIQDSHKKNKK